MQLLYCKLPLLTRAGIFSSLFSFFLFPINTHRICLASELITSLAKCQRNKNACLWTAGEPTEMEGLEKLKCVHLSKCLFSGLVASTVGETLLLFWLLGLGVLHCLVTCSALLFTVVRDIQDQGFKWLKWPQWPTDYYTAWGGETRVDSHPHFPSASQAHRFQGFFVIRRVIVLHMEKQPFLWDFAAIRD